MRCPTCHGDGWLLSFLHGLMEYWRCPACGGGGSRVQYAPAMIGPGSRKTQK